MIATLNTPLEEFTTVKDVPFTVIDPFSTVTFFHKCIIGKGVNP